MLDRDRFVAWTCRSRLKRALDVILVVAGHVIPPALLATLYLDGRA
jgi:hypothetical protein